MGMPPLLMSMPTLTGGQIMPPLHTVPSVDLNRLMGQWCVIAGVPTILETGARNGIVTDASAGDRRVDHPFTFNKNGVDGP